ncbi:MAG: oligopeptide transporter, OPT family [Acidobacteriaceae bacterium]
MSATQDFQPFVPPQESRPELTFRAIILGSLFGLLFGAVTVYVGLEAGLTVAASIPIAVLSISVLRALGRASILENNIVQTTGNAGQSIAAGVIFTLPALIFLGFDLEYFRIFVLAMLGGWLGLLFMIPLRRQLIVEEHGTLTYPEGTACADVLLAGEHGGSFASRVFLGLGLGGLYTLFQNGNIFGAWPDTPDYQPDWGRQHIMKGAAVRVDTVPEYLGVGYIIGARVAGTMFAGGVFSWLVLMPAIYFFGSHLSGPLYPAVKPVAQMSPGDMWSAYIRPMGAGAVAASGLITLFRTVPTIVGALKAGLGNLRKKGGSSASRDVRTQRDIPMSVVVGGSIALVALMWIFLTFKPVPGAQTGMLANLAASLLIVIFGFLFVTVSSRIVGLIGSSANPISGMTIATLMATAAVFLVKGWTAPAYGALAITVGGVVCIASANAGDTSQDLKTGFLVGGTPWKQQVALMIGVCVSTFAVGITLNAMNRGFEEFHSMSKTWNLSAPHDGVQVQGPFTRKEIRVMLPNKTTEVEAGSQYILLNALGSHELADGKYLYDPKTGAIDVQWIQGIGSEKAAAPQARLMATVINGILRQQLPWGLVLLGVFLVIAIELMGIRSLTFAVGSYLSIATTLAIFAGGMVRWMVDRAVEKSDEGAETESEISPGSLYASGLIAAGGIVGLMGVGMKLWESMTGRATNPLQLPQTFLDHQWVSVLMFALLASSLYYFARKPLGKK